MPQQNEPERHAEMDDQDIIGWFQALEPLQAVPAAPHLRARVLARVDELAYYRGLRGWGRRIRDWHASRLLPVTATVGVVVLLLHHAAELGDLQRRATEAVTTQRQIEVQVRQWGDTLRRVEAGQDELAVQLAQRTMLETQLVLAQRTVTDLRGQRYGAVEVAQALFPEPEAPVRMRGHAAAPPVAPVAAVILDVAFAPGTAMLLPESDAALDALGTVLTQPPYTHPQVRIEGHTDPTGAASADQALSEQQAASVKDYLVQHFGIDPVRLLVQGYGASLPRAPNATPEGRLQNRRIEVVNLGS